MEEKLDTCAEPAGCEAVGTGEGRDCSLLADMYPLRSLTALCSGSIDLSSCHGPILSLACLEP